METVLGDGRCAHCAAALAADQHYCLACGERRGELRYPRASQLPLGARAAPSPAPAGRPAGLAIPSPRWSATAVLVMLGFGTFVGAAASPRTADSSASAQRPVLALAPTAASAPAAGPAAPAATAAGSTASQLGDGAAVATGPAPVVAADPTSSMVRSAGVATSSTPTPSPSPTPPGPDVPAEHPRAPRIEHVFVIALHGQTMARALAPGSPASFLTELRSQGGLLTRYSSVETGALANGIALVSGQPGNADTRAGCPVYRDVTPARVDRAGIASGTGCVYPSAVATLPDQLTGAGSVWKAYVEDIDHAGPPTSCRAPAPGSADTTALPRPGDAYAAARNPFVYFHSIVDSADCSTSDVPLAQLATDLAAPDQTPAFSYVVPNLCHDGRDEPACGTGQGGLAAADAFLSDWAPKITGSPGFRTGGLLVVTFDAGPESLPPPAAGAPAEDPARVGALVVSPYVAPGTESERPYDHYSLLASVEDAFGLDRLGRAARSDVRTFGRDVYTAWGTRSREQLVGAPR